ncbi:MAG: ABC transporter permease [Lachnospiraceae bacterium]|nr:ABC transporter permease [Lachnospiraceae bacterium]
MTSNPPVPAKKDPARHLRLGNLRQIGILTPHIVWCAIFIIVPLLFVLYYTFTDRSGAFTTANLQFLGTPEILKCFGLSLLYALVATAVCLVLAYPLALAISKLKSNHQSLATLLLMLPMWVSFIIRTYTLKNIFNDNGIINQFVTMLGGGEIKFLGQSWLIILGMVYDFLPYMVMPIVTVLTGIDPKLHEAAADLGYSPVRAFLHVTLPLSRAGIISGITMVFVRCVSTFYISSTLSGGTVTLIGDKIESAFLSNSNFQQGSAMSFVLMILILISILVMNKFGDKESEELLA